MNDWWSSPYGYLLPVGKDPDPLWFVRDHPLNFIGDRMKWFLIRLDDGDPVGHYMAAKNEQAASATWTTRLHEAKRFTSQDDAESFALRRLPHMPVQVVPHPEG